MSCYSNDNNIFLIFSSNNFHSQTIEVFKNINKGNRKQLLTAFVTEGIGVIQWKQQEVELWEIQKVVLHCKQLHSGTCWHRKITIWKSVSLKKFKKQYGIFPLNLPITQRFAMECHFCSGSYWTIVRGWDAILTMLAILKYSLQCICYSLSEFKDNAKWISS